MILICAPIGSSPGANNSWATVLPRITTFPAPASSLLEKNRPEANCQSRTVKCAVVVPLIVVFQFLFS